MHCMNRKSRTIQLHEAQEVCLKPRRMYWRSSIGSIETGKYSFKACLLVLGLSDYILVFSGQKSTWTPHSSSTRKGFDVSWQFKKEESIYRISANSFRGNTVYIFTVYSEIPQSEFNDPLWKKSSRSTYNYSVLDFCALPYNSIAHTVKFVSSNLYLTKTL